MITTIIVVIDGDRNHCCQVWNGVEVKVDKETKSANREALLSAASRLLRERGVDGVGVAEISKAAGLTHGGFYRHFSSKEALVGAAVERTLMETAERAAEMVDKDGLDAFARFYLSPAHLDDRASGCAIAALGGDMSVKKVRSAPRMLAVCALTSTPWPRRPHRTVP